MYLLVPWELLQEGAARVLSLLKHYFFVLSRLNMIVFWKSPGSRNRSRILPLWLQLKVLILMWGKQLQREGQNSCAYSDNPKTREGGNGLPWLQAPWMNAMAEPTAVPSPPGPALWGSRAPSGARSPSWTGWREGCWVCGLWGSLYHHLGKNWGNLFTKNQVSTDFRHWQSQAAAEQSFLGSIFGLESREPVR